MLLTLLSALTRRFSFFIDNDDEPDSTGKTSRWGDTLVTEQHAWRRDELAG